MNIKSIKEIDEKLVLEFDCDNYELNTYLFKYARQNDKKNIAKTFVLADDFCIYGYYSLSNASLDFFVLNDENKRKLPKYPIPAIRIARLAVSKDYKKQGYGSQLLKDAFIRILAISKQTGLYFIVVDSKKEAQGFYEHYGFIKLDSFNSTYILPISTIEKAASK